MASNAGIAVVGMRQRPCDRTLAVPVENFDEIAPAVTKAENRARERVLLQHVLRHDAEPVEAVGSMYRAPRTIAHPSSAAATNQIQSWLG